MNPYKEKAIELVDVYLLEVRGADRYNYNLEDMNYFIAKQCAKIAVQALISECEAISQDRAEYWKEVLKEIDLL